MSVAALLDGPVADRAHNARHQMTEAEARFVLRKLESEVASVERRRQQAAFFAKNLAGKLSPEAVDLYRAYAESI